MTSPALAVEPLEDLLRLIVSNGKLTLQYAIATHEGATPELTVELSGPDTALLTDRNGELLHAIEHIAAKILRLEPEEHDRLSFDADRFKAIRDDQLRASARAAIEQVRETNEPFAFNAMTSRERRMLHLVLKESGLPTASSGEGPRRFVVLYPEGHQPAAQAAAITQDRTHQIRNSFRRR